jgi:phosphoribosyl isomerase A
MTKPLALLPAVDLAQGRAVQHRPVGVGSATSFGDPVAAALAWQAAGAEWIHLVDLDAALGVGDNRAVLMEIIDRLDVDVELSGGINDDDSLRAALSTGASRVIIGTAALVRPEWCDRAIAAHADRVALGLDVRGRLLSARGSNSVVGELFETIARLDVAGCARYIVTDAVKDGELGGPNFALLREVCAATERPIIASGGIATLDDIDALVEMVADGVEGAIVGTALYEHRFTLRDALARTITTPRRP